MQRLKKYFLFAVIGAVLYFLLSFHIIVVGNGVKLLPKSHMTLNYTFYNTKGKTNQVILSIDVLRHDGIGKILLQAGRISEGELERLTQKYDSDDS